MKYENASQIFPKELLSEIQKYAAGKLVYVPDPVEKKPWGEVSGLRHELRKRNQLIINMFIHGIGIEKLSNEFGLSVDTIKKIVYNRKQNDVEYRPTATSAYEYSGEGMLEEWVHTYLIFRRKNVGFSSGLRLMYRYYLGPVSMPLNLFHRSSGPEPDMKWSVDADGFEQKVEAWNSKLIAGEEVPPLLINYFAGEFEINCNNPLFEALRRRKQVNHDVIFWVTDEADYDDLVERYQLF